jgi:lysozyme family protein
MQVDYTPFIDRMIDKYEGPYGWNKADPGGPTKDGITCFDLAEERHEKMTTMAAWVKAVRDMPRSEAEGIYRTKYAAHIRFDDLGPGKDTVLLDYDVNSGIGRPIRVSRALLKLPGGNVMDDTLVAAINKTDANWFIDAVCTERLHFMHQIRGGSAWKEFGKGWGARVADLNTYSKHVASGTKLPAPPAPDLSKVPTPKANHDDPNLTKNTTGGAIAGGAGSATASHAAGIPYWAIGLIVGTVVIAGVVYAVYKHRSNTTANNTVVLPPGIPPQPIPGMQATRGMTGYTGLQFAVENPLPPRSYA